MATFCSAARAILVFDTEHLLTAVTCHANVRPRPANVWRYRSEGLRYVRVSWREENVFFLCNAQLPIYV